MRTPRAHFRRTIRALARLLIRAHFARSSRTHFAHSLFTETFFTDTLRAHCPWRLSVYPLRDHLPRTLRAENLVHTLFAQTLSAKIAARTLCGHMSPAHYPPTLPVHAIGAHIRRSFPVRALSEHKLPADTFSAQELFSAHILGAHTFGARIFGARFPRTPFRAYFRRAQLARISAHFSVGMSGAYIPWVFRRTHSANIFRAPSRCTLFTH